MATRFEALDELLDDALELPVPGRDGTVRTYRIPSPSAEDGLRVQRITNLATRLLAGGEAIDTTLLDDEEELDLISLCLGPAEPEMTGDGVDWAWRRHAGLTSMFWIVNGPESARTYWEAKGDPKMLAGNREQRRAKAKAKTGSASASTTRSTTSGTSTSARRATAKSRKPAAI